MRAGISPYFIFQFLLDGHSLFAVDTGKVSAVLN